MTRGNVGPALKALRQAAGMTLDDVAEGAGVSTSYLSRVENSLATPTANWVELVALAIGDHLASEPAA